MITLHEEDLKQIIKTGTLQKMNNKMIKTEV